MQCLDYEDLVESTEGYVATPPHTGAAIFSDIDFASMPPLLGYNGTLPITGCEVHLEIAETGDPVVAIRTCGKGRALAFTSGASPHWGCNFIY